MKPSGKPWIPSAVACLPVTTIVAHWYLTSVIRRQANPRYRLTEWSDRAALDNWMIRPGWTARREGQ